MISPRNYKKFDTLLQPYDFGPHISTSWATPDYGVILNGPMFQNIHFSGFKSKNKCKHHVI